MKHGLLFSKFFCGQIAFHYVIIGAHYTQGRDCAWEHAWPVVTAANVFLLELMVTGKSVASATLTCWHTATNSSAHRSLISS